MFGGSPGVLVKVDDINLSRAVFELHSQESTIYGGDESQRSFVDYAFGDDGEQSCLAVVFGTGARMYEVVGGILPHGFETPLCFLQQDDIEI